MVTEDKLLLRVARLKMRVAESSDWHEREILMRLIAALCDLADSAYPSLEGARVGRC